jgi:hypothetical protein
MLWTGRIVLKGDEEEIGQSVQILSRVKCPLLENFRLHTNAKNYLTATSRFDSAQQTVNT